MTPAARVQAAIVLLQTLDGSTEPADVVVGRFVRERRFIGAQDRRTLVDLVYAVLRHRARLTWWIRRGRAASDDPLAQARRAVIAALVLLTQRGVLSLQSLFDGSPYGPAPLNAEEEALAEALQGRTVSDPDQPDWVRLEVPQWLLPEFEAAFGDDRDVALGTLLQEAAVDLRVNTIKTSPALVVTDLAQVSLPARPTPYSPLALRVAGRRAMTTVPAYQDGLIEIQDEGAQIAALLTDARAGMNVVDFCAGAGGKTLALAAAMGNEGRIVALDIDRARLERAAPRLRRAGVSIAERKVLRGNNWLYANAAGFDRVLVDVPCSGTGRWRRAPDARWRLTQEQVASYRAEQADILDRAAPLVRPGGRLIYVTCSLLPSENQAQVERVLAARPEFKRLDARAVWPEAVGAPPPEPAPFKGPDVMLMPHLHGTDGFYIAILERSAT